MSLAVVDAGRSPDAVAADVGMLVSAGSVEAMVGLHTSDVHRAVERVTAGRVPYLFTPPHEGGDRLEGVALSGPGPRDQLQPVVHGLMTRRLDRWALVGSDYIWPHAVHAAAAPLIRAAGADVVSTVLAPLGGVDPEPIIAELRSSRAQAVILSLVGRDLATFNRAFAESGLQQQVMRASCALDETCLLECDGDESGELFSAMEWFAADDDEDGFIGRYSARWGPMAPPLGVYARGCYSGLHLVAQLAEHAPLDVHTFVDRVGRHHAPSGRLARAEGTRLVPV
jgi:ABC-type branched-subunit amino acid transport system substrate-binding protein